MGLFKALSRSEAVRRPLCWMGAQYIRLVRYTSRWDVIGGDIPAAFWDRKEPFILAFWHGRILMMPYCWRPVLPISMLISAHRDGLIVARIVRHLGIDTIVGSSTKGGGPALRTLLKTLKDGTCVGITPDGPHGPYMRAVDGVAHIARLSGAAIIPCAYSTRRRRVLRSWDRFLVAWPFSRGVFVWGEPIRVSRDAGDLDVETVRLQIEQAITAVTIEADSRMGHETPMPTEVVS